MADHTAQSIVMGADPDVIMAVIADFDDYPTWVSAAREARVIETGADAARLNPNGGAISIGHPLGGSGARIMTQMLHHMKDNGIRYGLQTMCEGGGMANATILELL